MARTTPSGWFSDPDFRHDSRYWDGARWTDSVGDQGVTGEDPLQSRGATSPGQADHERVFAWWCFGGTFAATLLSGIWSLLVGTASMGGDESELVRGWSGVIRNLPGYLLVVAVASLGVWFAARSLRHGARGGRSALIATSLALLFALSSATRDSAEVVMTTRAATVTWILFAVDVLIVGGVYLLARRWASSVGLSTSEHRRRSRGTVAHDEIRPSS